MWVLNCIGWRSIFFIYKTRLLGLFMSFVSNLFLLKVFFYFQKYKRMMNSLSKTNTSGTFCWDFFFQSNQFCAKELVKAFCVYIYNWTHLIACTRIWIMIKNAEGCQPVFLWLLLPLLCPLVWSILPSYFAEANYFKRAQSWKIWYKLGHDSHSLYPKKLTWNLLVMKSAEFSHQKYQKSEI